MSNLLSFLISVALLARVSAVDTPSPFTMTWSPKSFGPDGPWQAVQISIGSPAQKVALYPGGSFRSHLLSPRICSNTTLSPDVCYASAAGLYDTDSSLTALTTIISFPAATDYTHGGLSVQGPGGISALDQMSLGDSNGLRNTVIVPNVTAAVHDDVAAIYPNGFVNALQVGTLALGYLGTENQTFSRSGASPIQGSLIPGYLQAVNLTPSNSFGLQIGSVNSNIKGSLYFGGYDQNRICGNISTQTGPFAGIEPDDDGKKGRINLLDIAINVIDGPSPFNTSTNTLSINGLLANENSTIGSALSVGILPESPYLDLPKSTCDTIASWLPVTYKTELGLYTWNVNDPRYRQIVSSPSVLSFIFRKDQTNTQNITINVPFTLLNLTLAAPLVKSDTPYFPCNAQSNGKYSLGRSFLQAAFVGVNWNANSNQGVWWLAQAPGPNIGSETNVKSIQDQDTSISASTNDWATSWKGILVPFSGQAVGQSPVNSTSSSNTTKSSEGLSLGAKAGIGAGVAALAVGMIGLCGFLFRRKQKTERQAPMKSTSTVETTASTVNGFAAAGGRYREGGYGPVELNSHEVRNKRYSNGLEKDVHMLHGSERQPIYELGTDVDTR